MTKAKFSIRDTELGHRITNQHERDPNKLLREILKNKKISNLLNYVPQFSETPKQAAWFVNQGETTYIKPDNPAVSQF